ncbi:hairy/enhancer-of-split related with YRPW motif protein 1-like [Carcharodon carcharias]|uniref:hairy/enhancer-of-split related with YRPW motif protein 1-like n=1 Tax=Carcharodon carcharias TaxID=13397 RepID=UPI001B7F7805|nr:hairy/enhancer-of-split related with YRPW motif protein 1-like [Carcharodon carcharias]
MKRSLEFSSSDSEVDIEEHRNMKASVLPSTFSQSQARKKRRGIVEKRRRDRINNSLSELRRLVPSACEKQGSAKLEKAEILQMTVDHLKVLHTSGGKGYFETSAFATDYRILGFRECLSEVARYLSVTEGLDHSDPLKARLVSHLNTCASQREVVIVENSHQLLSAGYPHQLALTSLSHFSVEAPAHSFPPVEQSHHKESMLSSIHLEQLNKLAPTGCVVPVLTNAAHVPSSIFSVSPLSAIQFPFSMDPLPVLPAAAARPPVQAVKSGKHFWATEVGAF